MSIKPLTDKERVALQFERKEARNRKHRIYAAGYRDRKRAAHKL